MYNDWTSLYGILFEVSKIPNENIWFHLESELSPSLKNTVTYVTSKHPLSFLQRGLGGHFSAM
jgi:hypothetical protein